MGSTIIGSMELSKIVLSFCKNPEFTLMLVQCYFCIGIQIRIDVVVPSFSVRFRGLMVVRATWGTFVDLLRHVTGGREHICSGWSSCGLGNASRVNQCAERASIEHAS
jgi:hypothetical protein